ncbi:MAG: hypothetical protein ABL984_16290, partial [Pyrinomonadaceae bacterium]
FNKMTGLHHIEGGDSNLTEPDRIQRKFCQRKMTDFVRITLLVIPLAVNMIWQLKTARCRFTMNEL